MIESYGWSKVVALGPSNLLASVARDSEYLSLNLNEGMLYHFSKIFTLLISTAHYAKGTASISMCFFFFFFSLQHPLKPSI